MGMIEGDDVDVLDVFRMMSNNNVELGFVDLDYQP